MVHCPHNKVVYAYIYIYVNAQNPIIEHHITKYPILLDHMIQKLGNSMDKHGALTPGLCFLLFTFVHLASGSRPKVLCPA